MQVHGLLFTLMFLDLIVGQLMFVVGSSGISWLRANLTLFLTGRYFYWNNIVTKIVRLTAFSKCKCRHVNAYDVNSNISENKLM